MALSNAQKKAVAAVMAQYVHKFSVEEDAIDLREMAKNFSNGIIPSEKITELINAILDMIERKDAEVFDAQIRALLARPDAAPLLQGLAASPRPTLVACGRQDSWSPLAQHEAMQRLARGATLAVIEEAGHMAPMEQPEAVTAALRAWLEA